MKLNTRQSTLEEPTMSTYHDLLSKLQELRIILPNHSNKFNEILLKLNGFLKIKNSSNNFEGTYDFCQYIDQQLNALKNLIGNNESFNNLVNFWYKERDNISTSIFKYFKGEMVEQTSIQSEKLVTKQILQETHFVFSPILKNILDTEANCISADKQSASSKIFVEKISILTQQINKFIEQADAQTILSPVQRRLVIARNLLREHVAELQIKQPAAGSLEASILLMQENNLNQLNKKIESFEQAIDPVSLEVILALIRPEKSVPIQNQSQSLQPSIALNTNRAPSINSSLDIGPRLIKLLVTAIGHEQTYRRSIEINLSASLFTLQSTKDMAENRKKISSLQEEQLNQLQNKTQTSPITEELVTEINNNFINHLNKINELGKDGKFVNEDQLFKQAYIKLQQKLI